MKSLPHPALAALRTFVAALAIAAPAAADTVPTQGLVNYETPHVHPLDLTPDGATLLAVNTAAHSLEVFSLASGTPVHRVTIPVGIDPVSVRAHTATEAWVVNQVSDSVSIVDLVRGLVVATLQTDNEPADVVFAGSPPRAFVSCSDANRLNVFDPAQPGTAPVAVAIAGEEPRALAVSPDGRQVYAAIFESGNATTILHGRSGSTANVVSRPEGPHAGQNPPPNAGTQFVPPIGPGVGTPPAVSLIVRKSADRRWLDDNQGDWTPFVSGALASLSGRVAGWDLPDHDVAIVDAATLAVTYQKSLLTTVMALGVNPSTGRVSAIGTEARNEIRWEPNLNGRFLQVNVATFAPGGAASIADLNPHLTYTTPSVPVAVRTQSLGDPRGIAWRADGQSALVTGMGSNNVAVIDAAGQRLAHFPVGEGPTGVVLHEDSGRGYVLNKFSASISVIDLAAKQETARIAFYDPTPAAIKAGRPFLYNTHRTSGLGQVSCASCHVDSKTDRLSWDLGDPTGANTTVANASNTTGAATGGRVAVSAMKGPMSTQTLQDIGKHPSLHWRGDKGALTDFNPAFLGLMGAESPLSTSEMAAFKAFLDTIHLPPNPYRALDNSRPAAVTLPDGTTVRSATMNTLRGRNSRNNNCLQCHLGGGTRNRASNLELGQAFVAPSLSLFYKKLGYWPGSATGSTSGTGFFHDGVDSVNRAARVTTSEAQPDMLAELMTLEGPAGPLTGGERRQDTHAGVGRQVTLRGAATAAQTALLNQLVAIAHTSAHAALIAQTQLAGVARGFYLPEGATAFLSDRSGDQRTLTQLTAEAAGGNPVTFTLVAQGTEKRLSVDRDGDGQPDRDGLTLAAPGPQTSSLGSPVVLSLEAVTTAAPVTWSSSGLPTGVSLASGSGIISGTPTAAGSFTVTATARDAAARTASQTFTWTVTPPQSEAEPGLAAEYFAGRQLDTLRLTRIDPELNVFWPGTTAPGPNVPGDEFSVRWTGRIQPAFTETYTFVADCDDGVRVWIDGRLILDHWDQAPNTYFGVASQPVELTAGRRHDLRVEFQDFHSDAWLVLKWQSASQPRQAVPATRLFRPGAADTTPPTVTLSTTGGVVPGPFAVAVVFSEAVTGLEAADFAVTNGAVSALTGSGTSRSAIVTPAVPGLVTVELPAGSVSDAAGLPNAAATPLTATFAPPAVNRPPSVVTPSAPSTERGAPASLAIEAADQDGQNLIYAATGLPFGLVINSSTGLISGVVRTDAAPSQTTTVTVTDGSLTASASFAWTTTASATPSPGLRGDYFAGSTFEQAAASRIDPQLKFFWPGTTAPAAGVPGDAFSVRWTGRLLPTFSESHRFVVNCDDGLRLWVNGQLLLDHWNPEPSTSFGRQSAPITLTAGQLADIRVELQDFFSDAWIEVYWTSASQPTQLIPAARLFQPAGDPGSGEAAGTPRATGLRGAYFSGSLATPLTDRIDPNANFAWGLGAAAAGLPSDQFSVRWTGWAWPAVTGTHTFHVAADDFVRLWINDQLVIDSWSPSAAVRELAGTAVLTAGMPAAVRLEYFDNLGPARVELGWSAPGLPRQIIPQQRLSPEAAAPAAIIVSSKEESILAGTSLPALDRVARAALPAAGATLRLGRDPQDGWEVSFERPPGLHHSMWIESSADCTRWRAWVEPATISSTPAGAENVRITVPGVGTDAPPRQFFRIRTR